MEKPTNDQLLDIVKLMLETADVNPDLTEDINTLRTTIVVLQSQIDLFSQVDDTSRILDAFHIKDVLQTAIINLQHIVITKNLYKLDQLKAKIND